MNWYNFIFSEKKSDHLRRHLVFWLLWWIYFTVSFYHFEQSGLRKIEFEPWNFPFFIKSLLLLSVHLAACYYFINYLLPHYLLKARYVALAVQTIGVGFVILFASYFIYQTVVPVVNAAFNYAPGHVNQNVWWTSITSGLLSAPKVISAAAAIKLLKRWWLKQKEKERLEKEKLTTELQLLKAQIHPEFLFSSLDNIRELAQRKRTDKASALLLRLAEILSYMLYECDSLLVPLEKEIKAIKDYLLLKKTAMGNRLEIDIAEKGKVNDHVIAPLILLPFIENSFSFIDNDKLEKNWINLEFQIENDAFIMKIIHGKTDHDPVGGRDELLAKAIKRIDYFYSGDYELKTTIEPEMMMTHLKIALHDSVEPKTSAHVEQLIYAAV